MNQRRHSTSETPGSEILELRATGECKASLNHLMLLGNDGRCCDYGVVGGEIAQLEPEDSWAVDVVDHAPIRMEPDPVLLVS